MVNYPGPDGETRLGFCSSFLRDLSVGQEFACYLRPAQNFHLPHDPYNEISLIFIAAGCGIAPFRSFWQQKLAEFEEFGRASSMQLYFGCKNEECDFLKDEMEALEGIAMNRFVAFSRSDTQQREHVQDQVRRHGQEIFTDIFLKQGRIYVCGQVTMASAVNSELVNIIADFGRVGLNSAATILNKMKDEGRYCEDIFGQ